MVAPSWTTDLTDIILEPNTSSGWSALGGGASGLPSGGETDFFIQGTVCMSKGAWTNATKGFMYTGGGPWTIPTDGVLLGWMLYGPATGSLDTKANGGLRAVIGSSSTAYYSYYIGGKDTLTFETWIPVGIDANNATADATTGSPSGTESVFGVVANLPTTSGPTKGNPLGMDALRYGRHTIEYLNGETADYQTFAKGEAYANDSTRRWGNIEFNKGTYLIQGFHSLGAAGTAADFRDSNKVIFWRACAHNLTDDAVSAAYNRIEIINASTNVDWDNITFSALGTRARGRLVHTAGTFDAVNCSFIDMDTFSLLAASVMTDCTFRRTNAITAPGSTLTGSKVLEPTVAADASALVWNVATDPDGLLDDMEFTTGATAHHAINLGASSLTTVTLRGLTFTGFDAADAANGSVVLLSDQGSDKVWTINAVNVTGTVSVKKTRAGDTFSVVADPRTLTIEVRDEAGTLITDSTEVTLVKTSDTSILWEEDNITDGITAYAYTYGTDVACYVNVLSVANYVPKTVEPVTLINADQTLVVQLANERNYSNP